MLSLFRTSQPRQVALVATALFAVTTAVRADFSGNFDVVDGSHPAGSYGSPSGTFGDWTLFNAVSGGGTAIFDTTGSPNSVTLAASNNSLSGLSSFVRLQTAAPAPGGTVTFSYNFTANNGLNSLIYYKDSPSSPIATITSGSGSRSFSVNSGQVFGFRFASTSFGVASSGSLDVSSFSFVPVPEPSTGALATLGLLAVAGSLLRRRNGAKS